MFKLGRSRALASAIAAPKASTYPAALISVLLSMLLPQELQLQETPETD